MKRWLPYRRSQTGWAFQGTVSKALNGASDISETLQKTVIETAVEMGYHKLRRPGGLRKLCVLIANMEYTEPHHFGHELILGFRKRLREYLDQLRDPFLFRKI